MRQIQIACSESGSQRCRLPLCLLHHCQRHAAGSIHLTPGLPYSWLCERHLLAGAVRQTPLLTASAPIAAGGAHGAGGRREREQSHDDQRGGRGGGPGGQARCARHAHGRRRHGRRLRRHVLSGPKQQPVPHAGHRCLYLGFLLPGPACGTAAACPGASSGVL